MFTAWTRWFSRGTRPMRRPIRRLRPRLERLEARETPAIFFGGVRVAAADVNGDHMADIVTGAGPGGGPHVRVLDGATGHETAGFYAYDPNFSGGVFVAAGDLNGDGIAEIVTGAGEGGGPHVKIFNGQTGALINGFFAFDPAFSGGVHVAVGDVTGDGQADIVCGAGAGGAANVRIFNGQTLQLENEFVAYDTTFTGGVFVGVGDVNGDGRADIVTGTGPGGAPHVKVFNGADVSQLLLSFFAYDMNFKGGVTVAAGPFSSTSHADILTGAGPGGGPHVRVFSGQTGQVLHEFYAYDAGFRGGVYVTDPDLSGTGVDDIVTGAGPGGGPHVRAWDGSALSEITGFYAYSPITGPFAGFSHPSNGNNQPDTIPPTLTLFTTPPTAPVSTNQTITGSAVDNRAGATLTAQVDSNTAQPVALDANGNFSFTTSLPLNGQGDGLHTVTFIARDAAGNVSPSSTFTFTLQASQQQALSLDLAPENDGSTPGNHRTNDATVALVGTAPANATVILVGTSFSTTADAQGNFRFDNVPLETGVNSFTARATPSGGGQPLELTRLITRNTAPTVAGPVGTFHVDSGADATILNLPAIFSDIDVNSLIRFDTSSGSFDVELFDQQTPRTVANLLAYITSGAYMNSIFHRSVSNFVIQGGGFQFHTNPSRLDSIPTNPAVVNEPGISNQIGTIAMAKLGGDPNSATSQFFFNSADNSRGAPMLDTQNGGFTAFGQVRGDGMNIVNLLAAIMTQDRGGVFSDIPLQNYPTPPDGNFPADTTAANYAFINDISIVRQSDSRDNDILDFSIVSNSNPNLVQAAITGGKLTLNYTAGQSGRATITLRAVDSEGSAIETTFTVSVGNVADDTTAPTITFTDPTPGQTFTDNPTIHGQVTDDASGVFSLTASVDGQPAVPVTLDQNGGFTFATTFATDGSQDGPHSIAFVARDQAGNVSSPMTFDFTLTTGINELTLDLDAASDTANGGVAGNHRTSLDSVTLTGTTAPGATVSLTGTTFSTVADAQGAFSFSDVPLEVGTNSFTAHASDVAGHTRDFTQTIIRDATPTVANAVAPLHVAAGAQPTFLNLPAIFSDIDVNSLVRFTTSAGTFDVELFDQQTPLTVANFLTYVSSGRYTSSIFHRLVADFVLQGGGFHFSAGAHLPLTPIITDPAVRNEPGISNQLGTIAMAKLGGDPNSATSQFFFNLNDNSRGNPMLDTQNGGFTAFGQVRGDGMSVIQALAAIPVQNRGGDFTEIPLRDYPQPPAGQFPSDTTAANYALLSDVSIVRRADPANGDALTFSIVSNSNPNLVHATITGGKLTLSYTAGQSGFATLTIRATDAEGQVVDSLITVAVGSAPTDTTAPTVAISDPPSGQTVHGNVTIQGLITDDISGPFSLTASIDGGTPTPVTFDGAGSFSFATTFALDGSQDGEHTIAFVGRDQAGNVSTPVNFTMTLDTSIGAPLSIHLSQASDTAGGGLAGNNRTILDSVTLEGTAVANATVSLVGTQLSTTADAQGRFTLTDVPLALGVNAVTVRATVANGNHRDFTQNIIRDSDPTVAHAIADFSAVRSSGPMTFNLPSIFSDADTNSLVRFATLAGTFDVELFDQYTPITVRNFLQYASQGSYNGTIFHRAVSGALLQGGKYSYAYNPAGQNRLDPIPTQPPILNEPALSNLMGTLTMVPSTNQVDSATSEFLFNLTDNLTGPRPFDTQNGGYAVFGQVRGNGLQTLNSLASIPVQNRGGDFTQIPMQQYPQPPGGNFPGDAKPFNFAYLNGVQIVRRVSEHNGDALTFSIVENTNPGLVNATITGGRLVLSYAPGQAGNCTIRISATDAEGRQVSTSFKITVT